MKAIEGALGALMRDKIEQSKNYDETGITRCLILRAKLMLEAKEPLTALEDLQEVLVEDPNNIEVFCTQAKCMFLIGDFEKSLLLWHKAKKLRKKHPGLREAI